MWEMDYDSVSTYWTEKDRDNVKMDNDELRSYITDFIMTHNTCALATGCSDMVRCTPIEYNFVDGYFYLFSEGGLKFHALKENKNVGLAIYESYGGFGKLKGLQVIGMAEMVEPFSEEYNKLCAHKNIPVETMKKLPKPMNLIKVVPSDYDLLDSELKTKGVASRQHLEI